MTYSGQDILKVSGNKTLAEKRIHIFSKMFFMLNKNKPLHLKFRVDFPILFSVPLRVYPPFTIYYIDDLYFILSFWADWLVS